jgi:hypothetical protein
MFELRASARLVVWGNALLGGGVSPDEATDRIVGTDPPHRVAGLPAEPAPVGVALALGRLRTGGVTALRLVLPVPGDPGALPGPPAVNAVALEAGEAALTVDGVSLALVPAGRAAWQAYDVAATRLSLPSLAEAERMLTEELRDCAEELLRLDVARWAPEAATFLADRATSSAPPLPAVYPPRATAVLAQGLRLGALAELASRTEGAAVSASEIGQRATVLGRLAAASRRAVEAACNARL